MSRVNIFDVAAAGAAIPCGIGAIALLGPVTPLGAVVTFAGGVAAPVLAYGLVAKLALAVPPLPRCQKGRCRAADYTLERQAPEGDYLRCACGDLYLLTPDQELRIMNADGTSRAYLRRYYDGGPWRP